MFLRLATALVEQLDSVAYDNHLTGPRRESRSLRGFRWRNAFRYRKGWPLKVQSRMGCPPIADL
jgi:hypothetical protein